MIPYRLVKIGDQYLTDTKLIGRVRYICRVERLEGLDLANRGSVDRAASGNAFKFLMENTGAGVELRLLFDGLTEDHYEDIVSIIDTAENAGADTPVEITDGPTKDRSLQCIFGHEGGAKAVEYSANILNGQLRDVVINLTVLSINEPEP